MPTRFREEVLNVVLAQVLNDKGIASVPEQTMATALSGRKMPDVIVEVHGQRTVIEGKVRDHKSAAKQVLVDVRGRIDQGIAHMGIAILYPSAVRHAPDIRALRTQLESAQLRMSIQTEAGGTGWMERDVDALGDLLRRAFTDLVKEDVVRTAVATLESALEVFTAAMRSSPGGLARCAAVLGVGQPVSRARD